MREREREGGFRKLIESVLVAVFFVFVNSFPKTVFLTETMALKIASAASSGGQRTLTYFMYFRWSRLEAAFSVSAPYFLF